MVLFIQLACITLELLVIADLLVCRKDLFVHAPPAADPQDKRIADMFAEPQS